MATAESSHSAGQLQAAVMAELSRIVESPDFRQSEQSKRLLAHLVQVTLEDPSSEKLRERAIGADAFGLEPGYDTSTNPIVRVRVNEIRKRLAKYYLIEQPGQVRLEIPTGGYRVEFRWVAPVPEAPRTEEMAIVAERDVGPSRRRWLYAAGGVGALAAIGAGVARFSQPDVLQAFWGPALAVAGPTVLCSGRSVVYRLSRRAQEKLYGAGIDHYQTLNLELAVPEGTALDGKDVVVVPDQYIGVGTAFAVAQLHGWLQGQNKETDIRFGNELSFTDLRKSPAVLIGAFNNRWTRELTRGLRFVFDTDGGAPVVRDKQGGRMWPLPDLKENGQTSEDYVLISRVLRSPGGEFMIAGAGITQYGGRTVGEVLTNGKLLAEMLKGASRDWAAKNVQLLMKVKVIGGMAGPPELVALHEW